MNTTLFLRRFPWLPAFLLLALSGVLFLVMALWYWLAWTPIQRYYLGAYFESSLLSGDPAWTVDMQWLYKAAPHRKPELAADADAVPASPGGRIPVQLSPTARHDGWTGLVQGSHEQFYASSLSPYFEAQFFAGESIWRMLLKLLLWGSAAVFFMLAGRSMLPRRSRYKNWYGQENGSHVLPPPYNLGRSGKTNGIRFRLPKFMKRKRPDIAPTPAPPAPTVTIPTESPKKPSQAVLSFFDAPNGKAKEGFAWDKTKGID